jgi:hypothetical protein
METPFDHYLIRDAINGDDPQMVKYAIEAGADVNFDLGEGWTTTP